MVKEPAKQGYSFPSSIYLTESGEFLVGQLAESRKFKDITRYRREFKRDLLQTYPYFLGSQGKYQFTPQELVTEVLKNLKQEAEKITLALDKETITDVVITIPATYKKNKKDLMKEAGKKAGFYSVDLLEEPVAAANYYNHQNPDSFQEGDIILVYDLRGGTFDATQYTEKTMNNDNFDSFDILDIDQNPESFGTLAIDSDGDGIGDYTAYGSDTYMDGTDDMWVVDAPDASGMALIMTVMEIQMNL